MMKSGRVRAAGHPNDVMTDGVMEAVFGCAMRVNATPAGSVPFVLPHTAAG
jgi:iron complex transport system ATP-binding protein